MRQFFIVGMLLVSTVCFPRSDRRSEAKQRREHARVRSTLFSLDDSLLVRRVLQIVRDDIEFTDQIAVELRQESHELDSRSAKKLFKAGVSLCIYLKQVDGVQSHVHKIHAKLCDASSGDAVFEKTYSVDDRDHVWASHAIASDLIKNMTGEESVCMTQLAYCTLRSEAQRVICVSDYACKQEHIVVAANAVSVVPRWHTAKPLLFYTQFGKLAQSRLMAVNVDNGRNQLICSFKGLNMQPALSEDGRRAIMCLSRSGNSELYLYDQEKAAREKRRVFKQITSNGATNVSPCILPGNEVIFCSDYGGRVPQLYHLNYQTRKLTQLTRGGYAAEPNYCASKQSVVFTRPVGGIFQLFTVSFDAAGRVSAPQQLTYGVGDKHSPSWSKCGRYIACAYQVPSSSGPRVNQIAMLNLASRKLRVMTSGPQDKSYPAWQRCITRKPTA